MLDLSLKSLLNRRFVASLTVISIALSIALILGVERLRNEARSSFANSASGIDLIVAARGNDVQILMATVFGVGTTGTGISWDSFEMVEGLPQIAWTVPVLMGDNHRGYPVIGTSESYFGRFRHSGGKSLTFKSGGAFNDSDSAVVGAEVAQTLGYVPGTVIVNAHGSGEVAFDIHDEAPFTITGVLAPTRTAVDRMVFVSLEGFDALHEKRSPKAADPFATPTGVLEKEGQSNNEKRNENAHEDDKHGHENDEHKDEHADEHEHKPGTINAIFAGLTNKSGILSVQRHLADYRGEALSAVMPNVALLQLWSLTGTAETALRLMAGAVALAGMIGMVVMLSAALDARRREFAILRSVGATPGNIFALIVVEAVLLLLTGILLGYIILSANMLLFNPVLATKFGLHIGVGLPSFREVLLIALVLCFGLVASVVPALRVYRMTLADGLSKRL
ncbi:MAG: FtsX-like permease family protein [bacterium]|nr:FtsX-like permease family protein [bacterium]